MSLATRWRFTYPPVLIRGPKLPLRIPRSILSSWTVAHSLRASQPLLTSKSNLHHAIGIEIALKRSPVVLIGVDRHRVDRDDSASRNDLAQSRVPQR
jgi:hypothetical protein